MNLESEPCRLSFTASTIREQSPPSGRHNIRPYAAEHFPQVFENPECEIVAITAERTFWDLAKVGLIQSRVKHHVLMWMSGLMMAGVFGLGAVRIVQALGRGRPFGFQVA